MTRKLFPLAGVLVAVFSLAVSTQVADAQIFGGRACCDQTGYSGYGMMGTYGYGPGYGYTTGYGLGGCGIGGCGIGSGMIGSYGYPTAGCCGAQPYLSSGCGTCGTGCGRLGSCGFRRSSICGQTCGYPSYGIGNSSCGLYSGYGLGGGCYSGCSRRTWALAGRPYRSCGYQVSTACCLPSCGFTGAVASCCTPAPSTCCGAQSGGYTVQPGPATAAPTPIAPSQTLKPTPAPTPNPAPPAEPVTPAAPTPGT